MTLGARTNPPSRSWPERLSEGQIVPYYQPLVSVESLRIGAYEALGRQVVGGHASSLGPFFAASAVDSTLTDLHRDVDRSLRRAALTEFANLDPGVLLFLNVTPRLMVEHLELRAHELPWTLQVMAEVGMDPRRVVIELTEEPVGPKTESLRRLVDIYRAHGCAIAVDDVGAQSSNLDRVGYFEPDLIKIDALMLRRSLRERAFRQVLQGLGTMAEGLGASLVFEGVETEEELHQALHFGARYVQGWYFAQAQAQILPSEHFAPSLRPVLEHFGAQTFDRAAHRVQRIEAIQTALAAVTPQVYWDRGWVHLDPQDLERWRPWACRVFVTDRAGFQVSVNYEPSVRGWVEDPRGLGKWRGSRPYFQRPHGRGPGEWSVSSPYYDVNDHSPLRTYGKPLEGGLLLFVDVTEIEKQP